MTTTHHFSATRVVLLQFFLLSLLAPAAKSFFGNTLLTSVIGNIDNRSSRQEKNICSNTEKLQNNDSILLSPIERTTDTHQSLDASKHADKGGDLVFEGEFNYQSDIVQIPTTALSSPATDLFEFFSDPKNRDLVIKGGGNHCESVPLTPELHDEWTSQSKIVNSTPPNGNTNGRNEEILAVHSEVPIVPGLSLRAVSYTGCKTMTEPTSALPYYEFTLLKESYQPVGKKAMTWIFDKVTGNKKKNRVQDKIDGENSEGSKANNAILGKKSDIEVSTGDGSSNGTSRKTYALSRVMLKPCPQDGGCKICYYGHVRLTLSKKFLHMLPLPTKVVQTKVNKSIRRQLESECTRSIQKFSGALNKWNERNKSASVDVR